MTTLASLALAGLRRQRAISGLRRPRATPGWLARTAALGLLTLIAVSGLRPAVASADSAAWFPDPPSTPRYTWQAPDCAGCIALDAPANWRAMAALAGVPGVRFAVDPASDNAAFAAPPDLIVVGRALLQRDPCEQAFVVGHEIAHLARRHHDEDAHAAQVLSDRRGHWTTDGNQAVQLLDGDFGLALQLGVQWQSQEHEADWLGSLLAAQVCGCQLEFGAGAFLQGSGAGHHDHGVNASHASDQRRLDDLSPFRASIRLLAAGWVESPP